MMEKPQSKKAKTYSRFYGKQDHGDAAARKGRVEKKPDYGYWEQKFDERSAVNMAKNNSETRSSWRIRCSRRYS